MTFMGDGNGLSVLHKNGTHDDDRLDNLYWGTQKQNMEDAVRHGTHVGTRDHPITRGELAVAICNFIDKFGLKPL
jgi:hypothetical protein